jgi:carbonic anhydrase
MCEICGHENLAHRPSRRSLLRILGGATAGYALAGSAMAKEAKAPPKPQNAVSPDAALALVMAGNARYVQGVAKRHDFKNEREPLTQGQNPYAAILSCADSRVVPEYAFDSGRGDLFVCRVAGNYPTEDIVASFEYAVASLTVPLIMVLGHNACGAIGATVKSLKDDTTLPGHLPWLVTNLAPAVKASEGQPGDPVENAMRQNVISSVQKLKSATPIIAAAVGEGKVRVIGAVYRLADGHVELVA